MLQQRLILSGYRLMWMMVMFDLPVLTAEERKASGDFRLGLLDLGFERVQLSVYMRCCSGIEQITTYTKAIERILPEGGKITILQFTDKQYEKIITFYGHSKQVPLKNPDQILLF